MEDGVLTLAGETASDIDIPDAAYLLRELRFGKFSRTIPISRQVNPDQAKASLVQGTLTIELPKEEDTADIIDITPTG